MPGPDFTKKTTEILAKRAAYLCSNPDCRVSTVGPNADPDKATSIGEAAHIFGARLEAKRYVAEMTDATRAKITNGIWLCRNCHKLIDTDQDTYPSDLLFIWREEHEKYVLSELGNASDRIRYKHQNDSIAEFGQYPPIIRRIVLDKPDGWEWQLTAELMRFLNQPLFRKIKNLRSGLYIKHHEHISDDQILDWISIRLNEMSKIAGPITKLLEHLSVSFGSPGEEGNISEIHHVCCLIKDYLEEVVKFEEKLYFVSVSERAEKAIGLLRDCIGSQVEKLETIPDSLDEVVALIDSDHVGTKDNPLVITKTIVFDLPDGWSKKLEKELKKLRRESNDLESSGVWSTTFGLIFIIVLLVLIF